jgi:hypothetical protein
LTTPSSSPWSSAASWSTSASRRESFIGTDRVGSGVCTFQDGLSDLALECG